MGLIMAGGEGAASPAAVVRRANRCVGLRMHASPSHSPIVHTHPLTPEPTPVTTPHPRIDLAPSGAAIIFTATSDAPSEPTTTGEEGVW